jgi:sortase A
MINPLFPTDEDKQTDEPSKAGNKLYSKHQHNSKMAHSKASHDQSNPAADLIRQKIESLHNQVPDTREELKEIKREKDSFSKHQKFMYDLSTSGKNLAEIQTSWHNYYVALPDKEKYDVWQEFYDNNEQASQYQRYVTSHKPELKTTAGNPSLHQGIDPSEAVISDHSSTEGTKSDWRSTSDIRRQIVGKINAGGKLKVKHHVQSLLFGLGVGAVVVIITLFSFFNEYIIAPFIQPSREASATPLILGADNIAPTATPEVIIPKINVEIPLVLNIQTTDENQIENALEDGVIHYPTTVLPGQRGNAAFFGHSSNNIFNPGHYKFAFALLHDLVPGDTFYLTYNRHVYAYQVYEKQIVDPGDVSVLNNVPGKIATATLITCDPPGTSLHRLVVWGEQVSPSPSLNVGGSNTSAAISQSTQLPSNGPTLWSRMIHSITGWL